MESATTTAMQVAALTKKAAAQATTTVAVETPAAAAHHVPLTQDANFWIAVSFTIFALGFIRYLVPLITRALDDRASKIRDQLEQASRLREQAQELLASYKAEQEAKLKEAESILVEAKKEAENLRNQAAAELKQSLERRSQQAIAKIARAEQEATNDIRTQMINVAASAAADVVKAELEGSKAEDPALARALTAIERQIH